MYVPGMHNSAHFMHVSILSVNWGEDKALFLPPQHSLGLTGTSSVAEELSERVCKQQRSSSGESCDVLS